MDDHEVVVLLLVALIAIPLVYLIIEGLRSDLVHAVLHPFGF